MTGPAFEPGQYLVTFDRIGRNRPGPLETDAGSGEELADKIFTYARRHVLSSELEIDVLFDGRGFLTVGGMRNAGDFTWLRVGAS